MPKLSKITITDLQNIAASKGGKCLSTKYKNTTLKLQFECAAGHRWKAMPGAIRQGSWCAKCNFIKMAESRRGSIDTFHEIAEKHGGKCLSEEYKNISAKLKFECKNGHRFSKSAYAVKQGTWCQQCKKDLKANSPIININTFHEIAEKRGGKCLSTKYKNGAGKLEFECANGHRWIAVAYSVWKGSWCRKCYYHKMNTTPDNNIGVFQKIALQRGGKCLSTEFRSNNYKLQFECAEGHHWWATGVTIKKGTWCRKCFFISHKVKPYDVIETYHALAKARGGKCLSTEYIGANKKLEFECAKGHRWSAVAGGVKHGSWCMQCFREKNKVKRKGK
jgi:thiol-disulfide isomerase/thioredoxin